MGNEPKYMVIYNQLKKDILSKKYPAGTLLPTENELTKIFSVSKITVRHALQLLRDAKLVNIQQGRGIEVIAQTDESEIFYSSKRYQNATSISVRYHAETHEDLSVSPLYVDIYHANMDVAHHMDIPVGTDVYRIERTHSLGDIVVGYTQHYLPMALCPDINQYTQNTDDSLYDILEKHYGIAFTEGTEYIGICKVNFAESRIVNVPVDTPMFLMKRNSFCSYGLLEYCRALFNPEYFELAISLRSQ